MTPQQDRIRRSLLHFQLSRALEKPLLRLRSIPPLPRHPISIASQRICLRDAIQKRRLTTPRQPAKCTFTNFVALLVELTRFQMLPDQRDNLASHVITVNRMYVDAIEKSFGRRDTCFLMSARAPTAFEKFSSRRLAKIMGQRGQHHRHLPRVREVVDEFTCAIDHQLRMYKNVSFRMPFRILRHSDQALNLRKQFLHYT